MAKYWMIIRPQSFLIFSDILLYTIFESALKKDLKNSGMMRELYQCGALISAQIPNLFFLSMAISLR